MTTIVEVVAHSDNVETIFPQKCVYCCGPAEGFVEAKLSQAYTIGDWTLELSKKFALPPLMTKRIRGFDVSQRRHTLGNRTLHINCKSDIRIPYCRPHLQLNEEIVKAKDPISSLTLWLTAPIAAILIYLVYAGDFVLIDKREWLSFLNYVFAVGLGLMLAMGVDYLFHKFVRSEGPPESADYLESDWTGAGGGGLGWRGYFGNNEETVNDFLTIPKIPAIHEFTNNEFAILFAEANGGVVKSDSVVG